MVLDKMGGLIVETEPRLSQAWGEEEENKVRKETTWKRFDSTNPNLEKNKSLLLNLKQVTSLAFPVSTLSCLAVNQFGFVVIPTDILFDSGDVLVQTPPG